MKLISYLVWYTNGDYNKVCKKVFFDFKKAQKFCARKARIKEYEDNEVFFENKKKHVMYVIQDVFGQYYTENTKKDNKGD